MDYSVTLDEKCFTQRDEHFEGGLFMLIEHWSWDEDARSEFDELRFTTLH